MKRIGLLAALLALPSMASADVIAPEEDACQGKSKGAACAADGRDGQCLEGECCRNDYSNGTPPERVCSPCLTCQDAPTTAADGDKKDGCSASASAPAPWAWSAALLGGVLVLSLRRRRS